MTGKTIANHDQNFWQLASIQSAALGFPGIIFGVQLAKKYGVGAAICSLSIGNLILWLVGVVVISMVSRSRFNAIENVKSYLGKAGGMLAALIFMFAFISWYGLQIYSSVFELSSFFSIDSDHQRNVMIRFGVACGLLAALLSIGGIRLIKWIAVISLPILFIYHFFSILSSDYSITFKLDVSVPAIISSIFLLLPGMINLPTFFRHSRSRADSFLALTIMTLFITFFQISSIWMAFINIEQSIQHPFNFNAILQLFLISLFIVLLLTNNNLLNIYFASACWEMIVPGFGGSKQYAIIGLLGTTAYTFIQISSPMLFFVDLANSFIANLGIVMLIAFLVRIVVKHRPRTFEKLINGGAWLIGCLTATVLEIQNPEEGIRSSLISIGVSTLFFLCVVFIEETIWATKKILKANKV